MLSIKGGHVVEAREARRPSGSDAKYYSFGCATSVTKLIAAPTDATSARASGGQRVHHRKLLPLLANAGCMVSGQHAGKRAASNIRLMSIIALIVISMLSRECTARTFLGMDASNSNQQQDSSAIDSLSAADKQQAWLASGTSFAPIDLDYVLELGCRNLVDSILYPSRVQPRDQQRAAMEFMEFMDNERIKRLSPKHTPRFGK